ncbi:MAG TPA: GTPase Era [Gammaproteobacteria bacterium]|nr:GTPase Era [Gammaproteobacteria bacterium]HIK70733.1 GTPase Era [Pseudomonadales bacterium]
MNNTRCGYIAIVGRPNVGKSTLLNSIMDQKISITSKKPQTTRHQLLGIKTRDQVQFLYVDTPGIHANEKKAINRYMNRNARSVIRDVDAVIFVVDRGSWNKEDELVAEALQGHSGQLIIAVNKFDLLESKNKLLPVLEILQKRFPEAEIVPVSALTAENIELLENLIAERIPYSEFYFPDDQITDRSERFMVAEIIREKLMRQLGDEVPYSASIQIDRFERTSKIVHIDATIFVEREGQKSILIGSGGSKLKRIGSDARIDIERLLDRKIMLTNWVKVKSGWSDSERALKSLGYDPV